MADWGACDPDPGSALLEAGTSDADAEPVVGGPEATPIPLPTRDDAAERAPLDTGQ